MVSRCPLCFSVFSALTQSFSARSYFNLPPAIMKVSSTLPVMVAIVVVAVNSNSDSSGPLSSYQNVAEQPERPRHITNDYEPHYDRAKVSWLVLPECRSVPKLSSRQTATQRSPSLRKSISLLRHTKRNHRPKMNSPHRSLMVTHSGSSESAAVLVVTVVPHVCPSRIITNDWH
jgi:hypothetical protein